MRSEFSIKNTLLVLFLSSTISASAKLPEVHLPSTFKVADQQLILNGSGIREKCFIDLYVGGLYLKEKSSDASMIINANEPMAIKIDVISNMITSKRLEEGMRSEFKRVTNGNIAPFKDRIDLLVKAFHEDIKVGDVFDLIYHPSDGLKIYKNHQLSSAIPGLDFKKMVFSTWFGEDPGDLKLKKGMLGI